MSIFGLNFLFKADIYKYLAEKTPNLFPAGGRWEGERGEEGGSFLCIFDEMFIEVPEFHKTYPVPNVSGCAPDSSYLG